MFIWIDILLRIDEIKLLIVIQKLRMRLTKLKHGHLMTKNET